MYPQLIKPSLLTWTIEYEMSSKTGHCFHVRSRTVCHTKNKLKKATGIFIQVNN